MAPAPPDGRLRLRLYVSGSAPNSARAVVNLRSLCAAHFESAHDLEIVDILREPARAMADGVIVSPTLLKLSPSPIARVIGDLSDTARVRLTLDAR